jgi:cyclohexanone monooxygenase
VPQGEDLVDDVWTDLIGKMMRRFREGGDGSGRSLPEILELANLEKMNEIRARAEELVEDPETAEALKPYYAMFCKRPCFHDEYLQTFNRPNVKLVDTDGRGVERITRQGVVAGGVEYEVDCIIFATGFEVGTSYERRAGYEIVGRDGRTLTERWEQDGVRTLHGILCHDHPNCFIMSQMQGGFTANYPHMLDEVATHIAYIVKHAFETGSTLVEATAAAEKAWADVIVEKATGGPAAAAGGNCTPGYYNNEGRPNPRAAESAPYGGGSIEYFEILRRWRDAGELDGVEFDT